VSRLDYRRWTVLWMSAFIIACVCWILLGPDSVGRRQLKVDGDLTIFGYIVLLCGLFVLAYALPHLAHVLLRRPAIEVDDNSLRIWMLPYETIPLAEISQVLVDDGKVEIFRDGKRSRRINTGVLDEPRAFFFDEVGGRLPSKEMVQEK